VCLPAAHAAQGDHIDGHLADSRCVVPLRAQNQDFRIQYEAIQRVFVLPRNHSPLTLVVLAVDPPVRKGQTHYSHVLAQFPTDEDVTVSLQLSPEQMAEKNEGTVRGRMGGLQNNL